MTLDGHVFAVEAAAVAVQPPFFIDSLPLILAREEPAAVTAHCLMHNLRLVPCGEPTNDNEFAGRVELDGEWFW